MKQLFTNYSISGSTITLTGLNIPLSQLLCIEDNTSGKELYATGSVAPTSYTQATNSTITVSVAPSANTDKLTIYYDDGVANSAPSSTVTANAGTNLNTSALALESGGNLATTATKATAIAAVAGTTADTAWSSGAGSLVALGKATVNAINAPLPAGTNSLGTVGLNAGTNAIGSITNTAFTANAGTNLNTSALALETGGNLATVATKTTAISAQLPSTLGVTTKANSLSTAIATDQLVNLGATTASGSQPVAIATDQLVALGQAAKASSQPVVLATDQPSIPVAAKITAPVTPPSAQSIAATGTIGAFAVQGGQTVALTLTNAPAATATWVGTVGFQWSPDGSTWNALTAIPKTQLPGSNAVGVTSTTTAGLWLASLPDTAIQVRYNVTAWTSGTIWGFVESWQNPNAVVILPFVPTVTSGQTLIGPLDVSGISEITVHITAATTTQLTFQGSNDPTFTAAVTLTVQDTTSPNSTGSGAAVYTTPQKIITQGFKWFRAQCTTTGTVLTVQGASATLGSRIALTTAGNALFVTTNNNSMNMNQYGGSGVVNGGVSGVPSVGGNIAIGTAATANPVPVGGRVTTTLPTNLGSNGLTAGLIFSTASEAIIKPFGSAENDFNFVAPPSGLITNSTTPVTIQGAPAASIRNYYTSLVVNTDSLGTATELVLRDVALTLTTTVLSSNTLVTSTAHGLAIGDAIVFQGVGGLTGLTATTVTYYVLTVPSTTSFTLAATIGGSTLTVTGTPSASQTLNHILWRTKLQTAGILQPLTFSFASPLKGGSAVAQEAVTLTASTGAVYLAAQGFRHF